MTSRDGTEHRIERDGCPIYYDSYGDTVGAPVVLINGHGRTTRDFKTLSRRLAAQNLWVIACENRGVGRARTVALATLGDLAGDIVAILDHCGIAAAHMMGFSMGGMVLQILLARDPSRIASASLVGSSCRPPSPTSPLHLPWSGDPEHNLPKLAAFVGSGFAQSHLTLLQAMARDIAVNTQGEDPQAEAIAAFYLGPPNPNPNSDLPPVYVIHGREDRVFGPQDAETLAAKWHATLTLLADTGHLVLLEQPSLLEQHLGKVTSDLNLRL